MNSPDWRDHPATAHFGPAAWQARLLAVLSAIFVRPVLSTLTVIGVIVNRLRPDAMQRARLDVIDKPLRVIRALPGTDVTPVALPHCTVNGTRPPPLIPPEADLHGLGPFLLQVGTDEMLLNDTFALAERLRADGVPVWVQVWHKAMHMFQLSFDLNPDARRAVDEVAAFIRDATAVQSEASA